MYKNHIFHVTISLQVKDKITGRTDVYCGSVAVPFTWTSEGNVIVMTFLSDLTNSQYSGFVGSYTIDDREDLLCKWKNSEQ